VVKAVFQVPSGRTYGNSYESTPSSSVGTTLWFTKEGIIQDDRTELVEGTLLTY